MYYIIIILIYRRRDHRYNYLYFIIIYEELLAVNNTKVLLNIKRILDKNSSYIILHGHLSRE